jgi:hypothetical protein
MAEHFCAQRKFGSGVDENGNAVFTYRGYICTCNNGSGSVTQSPVNRTIGKDYQSLAPALLGMNSPCTCNVSYCALDQTEALTGLNKRTKYYYFFPPTYKLEPGYRLLAQWNVDTRRVPDGHFLRLLLIGYTDCKQFEVFGTGFAVKNASIVDPVLPVLTDREVEFYNDDWRVYIGTAPGSQIGPFDLIK